MKMLVRVGAGVCVTDNTCLGDTGCTCLMLAAHGGHTETVRYLVGLPEVDVKQGEAKTALHCAVRLAVSTHRTDVVQLTMNAGSFPFTPLNNTLLSAKMCTAHTYCLVGKGS